MRNRVEEIKARGFDIVHGSLVKTPSQAYTPTDYSNLKVGLKQIEDAVIQLGDYKRNNPQFGNKDYVLKAIKDSNVKVLRAISDYFYKTSAIYGRVLRYMAYIYKYDWYVVPYVEDRKMSEEKIVDAFTKCLRSLDDFEVKRNLGEIALTVLRHGAYYGYKVETSKGLVLQELHPNYCRTRYKQGKKPAVEFNMAFFKDYYSSEIMRERIVKTFPKEFQKGYKLYKEGKLVPETPGDESGWYLLNPDMTVRFTANGEEIPMFISLIPHIIDLDEAKDLDKKRSMQRLLKIVIQKMPLDKNGELIFDVEEARQLHNNAVQMLSKAIGIDVLTTFADVDVQNLSDSGDADTQSSDMERAMNAIYTEAGISYLQFNTDSSAALEKSTLNDASAMRNLLQQFEAFLNDIAESHNKGNKLRFKAQLLETTIYNYIELSKIYKEQMQVGFSKMLPQIALGMSQSSILSNAYFENDILNLVNVFIPPLMSSTMNENILDRAQKNKGDGAGLGEKGEAGRPTNESKGEMTSEKTIANRESM